MKVIQVQNALYGLALWIIALPFLIPFALIFGIWRLLATLYVHLRYRGLQPERLNYYDTFASMQETGLMIGWPMWTEANIDVTKIRAHFRSTFISNGKEKKFPVFFQSTFPALGYMYKKRCARTLDLERHIRELEIPPDTDNLDKYLLHLMKDNDHLIGENIPKWEIVVAHLPDHHQEGKYKSIFIMKISHALADAYSYFYLLNTFCGNDNPYKAADKKFEVPMLKRLEIYLKAPYNIYRLLGEFKKANRTKAPFGFDIESRTEGKPNPKLASSCTLSFPKIRELSKSTVATVTGTLISIKCGALQKWGEKLGGHSMKDTVKEPIPITYIVPLPHHPVFTEGRTTNHLAWGHINIALNHENSHSRLRDIQKSMEENQEWNYPQIFNWFGQVRAFFLTKHLLLKDEERMVGAYLYLVTPFVSSTNFKVTGIPVEKLQLSFNGNDLDYAKGLAFGTITKGTELTVTMGSAHPLFVNQEELDYFTKVLIPNELEVLWEECGARSKKIT